MKSFLQGSPIIKLGLNEKLIVGEDRTSQGKKLG
jgi:hypothetical protein